MTEKQNKFFITNQFWRPHYKNWNWTIVDENDEIVIELPFEENCEEVLELLMKYIDENEQLKSENKRLKEDLEHCANQFTNDGKNVLLSLR